MSSNKAALLGGILGLSIAVGVLIFQDKGLRKEAHDQLSSVLKTTGKIVRHYRSLGDRIAGSNADAAAEKPAWDRVLENIRANTDPVEE